MKIVKIITFIVIAVAFISGGMWYDKRLDEKTAEKIAKEQAQMKQEQERIMASFIKEEVVVGKGAEAGNGDRLVVNYEGMLEDGTKFDSSYERGQPFEFVLGAGQVIPGWDLGLLGMRVGGKRNLTIPPELGYGSKANGPIPPNSTLKFTVELLEIKNSK
jgi:FKBP-type peptidyl-prolyl cis-trans isomerase